MTSKAEEEVFMTPKSTPICLLDSREAFAGLTDEERRYAHWMGIGSWAGALSCFVQCSPESPPLFSMREESDLPSPSSTRRG
jgi:dipeptidyl-peptidase III